jgi:hypothetical protein
LAHPPQEQEALFGAEDTPTTAEQVAETLLAKERTTLGE